MIKRCFIQTHVLYSCFCAEMTGHSGGSFMFYSLTQKLDSSVTWFILSGITQCSPFFANGRVRRTTCSFLWGDLANSERLVCIFFKMCELYGSKTIFWTLGICFCLDCYTHLFSNPKVGRLFKRVCVWGKKASTCLQNVISRGLSFNSSTGVSRFIVSIIHARPLFSDQIGGMWNTKEFPGKQVVDNGSCSSR